MVGTGLALTACAGETRSSPPGSTMIVLDRSIGDVALRKERAGARLKPGTSLD
jgi:hypothetical protein